MVNVKDIESHITKVIKGHGNSCGYCDLSSPLIIYQGEYTYVTLAIGQILEGYVQICPIAHLSTMTSFNEETLQETLFLIKSIRNIFNSIYGTKGIVFEHGEAGSCLWETYENSETQRAKCTHSHVHLIASGVNLKPSIRKALNIEHTLTTIRELKTIRENIYSGSPYIFFQDTNDDLFIYPVIEENIPPYFMRTILAKLIHAPHLADWKKNPGTAKIIASFCLLKDLLQEHCSR